MSCLHLCTKRRRTGPLVDRIYSTTPRSGRPAIAIRNQPLPSTFVTHASTGPIQSTTYALSALLHHQSKTKSKILTTTPTPSVHVVSVVQSTGNFTFHRDFNSIRRHRRRGCRDTMLSVAIRLLTCRTEHEKQEGYNHKKIENTILPQHDKFGAGLLDQG